MIWELRASSRFWGKVDKNQIEPEDRYLQFTSFGELVKFLNEIDHENIKSIRLNISTILDDEEYDEARKDAIKELDLFGKETESYMDKWMKGRT
jgi:hypothetical protein